MSRAHTIAIMLSMMAVGTAPGTAQERSESGDVTAVREVIEAVAEGFQAGDFASLDRLFSSSPGLHIIEGVGVNHGWADYRDHHFRPEFEAFRDFEYRWYAIEPVVSGDAAWAPFRYDLSAVTERGPIDLEGRGTIVLSRVDGTWQVVHLHTSGRPRR